jgi:predicted enzyme related to lactoylglutathione lyase
MIADPDGAIFALWKSVNDSMAGHYTDKAFNWNLLVTKSVEKAWKFYSAVFENWERVPYFNILSCKEDAKPWGGIYSPSELPCDNGRLEEGDKHAATQEDRKTCDQGSYWLHHIQTDDVDAIIAKAKELGCKMLCNPTDVPDVAALCTSGSRLAGFMDPQGVHVNIMNLKLHTVKLAAAAASSSCCATVSEKSGCCATTTVTAPECCASNSTSTKVCSTQSSGCSSASASAKSSSCESTFDESKAKSKLEENEDCAETEANGKSNGHAKHVGDRDETTSEVASPKRHKAK